MRAFAAAALVCSLLVSTPAAAKKKKKEEETQTLQLPKELPTAIQAETGRLQFYTTPLSARGLLSAQVRNALKALWRQAHGATIYKIRAFVAGSGDVRRVRDLVSATFTDKKQPLPVLSLAQAGALPLDGAQVVLEAIAGGKKVVNPNGLVFISPRVATSDNPVAGVAPLTAQSLAGLRQAVQAAGAQSADVLRVTCFLSSLENLAASRQLVEAEYPRAALDYIQTQRAPTGGLAACEAVARLHSALGVPLKLMNVPGEPPQKDQSGLALVGAPWVVLTGMQISFGYREADSRLAFERLVKELEKSSVRPADVAYAQYYALSSGLAAQVRALRPQFFDGAHPPAGTLLLFQGLPAMDAGFAVDVVAVKPPSP